MGSGQINHIGFKASAKVWDFKKKIQVGSHELHKVGDPCCISLVLKHLRPRVKNGGNTLQDST